jgi:hypothetical protein
MNDANTTPQLSKDEIAELARKEEQAGVVDQQTVAQAAENEAESTADDADNAAPGARSD